MCWLHLQDESAESMQNEGAYRAVLYTCVAAHWVTLLTAMHLVGTSSINPLALLGETPKFVPASMRTIVRHDDLNERSCKRQLWPSTGS